MAKKKKTPKTSVLTTRTTEAPMLVTRPADVAPVEVAVAAAVVVEAPAIKSEIVIESRDIARLAFAKFAARGFTHGHAVADWLAAEAELRAAHAS